jgi:uncharacterized membrane protein
MENTFIPTEAVKVGWEKMKKHFWFFVGMLILVWLIQVVPTGIANVFKGRAVFIYIIFIIAAWLIQILVKIGVIRITLDILDKGEASINSLFSGVNLLVKFILASILYFLIVFAGFILLIVPGIIWAIKYQFFAYLIVDKEMSPMEAIKKSGEITTGNKGKLFWLAILFILINIAGALCLLVGLLATIPTTMVAMAYVYRKLLGEAKVPEQAEPPADVAPPEISQPAG